MAETHAPPPHVPAGTANAGNQKLAAVKTNAAYLLHGKNAAVQPKSVATRGLLTTCRYLIKYMIRRMFRVAKYAAIGATVAVVGTTVLGALGTGVAWFAAPSLGMGIGTGIIWGLVKFSWRHRPDRFRSSWWESMKARADAGSDPAKDEAGDAAVATEESHVRKRAGRDDIWMEM